MSYLRTAMALSMLATALGCAGSEPESSASFGAEQAITGTDGYHAIAPTSGAVYQSLAVANDVAFVGDTARHIDIVDLSTLRKTGSVAGRIVADSLTTTGDKIIACGLRDDSPIDPFGHTPADRSYVLTIIDAATRKVDGEVKLEIESFLASNPRSGFVDLPELSCRANGNAMTITFSQEDLGREVVTFPLPAVGSAHDWRAIPNAKRTKIDAGGEATLKAAVVTDAGITYAAGGWGLRQQAPTATRAKSLRSEDRETIVDVQVRGEHLYAADNSGGLIVTTLDGKTVERVDIEDFIEAVALTPTNVVVLGRKGLFVAKDRWMR